MAFRTIHTLYGLQRMAAAEATGVPIGLTHMAVGDGNGNPTTPDTNQTMLVRERYRATINRVYQRPEYPTQFIAELVVPKTAGGFTLREIAVFDDTGSMFAVGNLPNAYMPGESEGAYADAVIRCIFEVSNASVVNIMVDPTVAMASQQWVLVNINAAKVIPGGLTGQFLAKQSNTDGDYVWTDLSDVNVNVQTIEESQTLAALQTTVDFLVVSTNGLAVYIEGVRLRKGSGVDEWDVNPADPFTSIILGQSYPADTVLVGVQNDQMGSAIEPLEKSQNLADVPNKVTARANLDVHSRAESDAAGQPGDIKYTASNTAPAGWIKANGAAINRTAYANLFAKIGTTFGLGDGINTFNLPDLRGEFIRGWDDGRGIDAGRVFGAQQGHAFASHTHGHQDNGTWIDGPGTYTLNAGGAVVNARRATQTLATGGTETRPRNIALLGCIKF